MPNILTESMYALVSASVSAIDGHAYGVQGGQVSAFLGTMYDFMHKLNNRILTASTTLISGGSAGAIALSTSGAGGPSGVSGIMGTIQGWPFYAVGEAFSAQPGSAVSTTSTQIRKVLVCLTTSSLPVASSLGSGWAMQLVIGSAYATASGAASTGGVSALFNLVPLPKPSAMQIPVGWLNIPNACPGSAGISNTCMITDYRETQGFNFSALQGTVWQP